MTPGEIFGHLRYLRASKRTQTVKCHGKVYTYTKAVCECVACGALIECSRSYLYDARNANRSHCNSCREVHTEPSGSMCQCCYNLPHRRPVVGLCRCGERYEAEFVLPAEAYRGRSNIADCEAV